ncbi:MerR family transcriptional regulator [Acholeplasma manati]|uniref:MerR family transcriptional regulator n=1 Tax=Paracholeplasma manati TaxID=591373 RepID=A0ABT2Y9B9_9MOLU|nr:MerR family transcriptional regulator [Paracholeplasma manati]MCV2232635.1 MerR family transcriptional regulator [Paracholeplasma manati]
MRYTIDDVSKLTGLSKRALRFYEEKGLVFAKRNEANYRFYDSADLDRIQTILFLTAFDIDLQTIKGILDDPKVDLLSLYETHLGALYEKRAQLDLIISNLSLTIDAKRRDEPMKDSDKFKGFKQNLIDNNDKLYKKEVIEKYGEEAYQKSRKAFSHMSEADFERFGGLERKLFEALEKASTTTGDVQSLYMKEAYNYHKEWLTMAWGYYHEEAHLNICQMYLDDERFKKHYDDVKPGFAQLLFDSVKKSIR